MDASLTLLFSSTSVVPAQPTPDRWLARKSKHRVWIKSIQLYVFCDKYREASMRRSKAGAFEIRFITDEGMVPLPPPPRVCLRSEGRW